MSTDPFANTTTVKNILQHVLSPKIVSDGSGGYVTKTDLVNIDTVNVGRIVATSGLVTTLTATNLTSANINAVYGINVGTTVTARNVIADTITTKRIIYNNTDSGTGLTIGNAFTTATSGQIVFEAGSTSATVFHTGVSPYTTIVLASIVNFIGEDIPTNNGISYIQIVNGNSFIINLLLGQSLNIGGEPAGPTVKWFIAKF